MMNDNFKIKNEIIEILANYVAENPEQRFGQILFNLDINQFKASENEKLSDDYQIRDIYNDEDSEILFRLKDRIKLLKSGVK